MQHNYSFDGEHIILRPMNESTSELYRVLRNREDNREFFFHSTIIEKEQQVKWFNNYLLKEDEYMFSILFPENYKFVGAIGIYNINQIKKTAEIGRIIIDRYIGGGKGYGTEAINCVSDIARRRLGTQELYAYIYSSNTASVKAFLKADFLVENKMKDNEKSDFIRVSKFL